MATAEERRVQRNRQRTLLIARRDEEAMAEWRRRHPEDVIAEHTFYANRRAQRRAERADRRMRKALAISQTENPNCKWDSDDDRFLDAYLSTSDDTDEEGGEDDDEV